MVLSNAKGRLAVQCFCTMPSGGLQCSVFVQRPVEAYAKASVEVCNAYVQIYREACSAYVQILVEPCSDYVQGPCGGLYCLSTKEKRGLQCQCLSTRNACFANI